MSNLPNDGYLVANQIIYDTLYSSFEFAILQKEIQSKCRPYASTVTCALLAEISQSEFLVRDRKLDDCYLKPEFDDLEEPLPISVDNCLPKGCNVQVRNRPVVEEPVEG
jgi:hypothetical protein